MERLTVPVFGGDPLKPGLRPVGHECLAFRFYLGAPEPSWLAKAGVPLFVSRRRLARLRTLPRAIAPWGLDSGAFTEIATHGRWTLSARAYATEVRRYAVEVGRLAFAAPQDWMCEPVMLQTTGLTIAEHQRLTLANYLQLRQLAPDLPFIPVLQGWKMDDYEAHWEMYAAAGVELETAPLVGISSVCRRQNTAEIAELLDFLAAFGIRGHAFGLKKTGIAAAVEYVASADSMAWSLDARRQTGPRTCRRGQSCSNCLHYALDWRARLFPRQVSLPLG